MMKKTTIGKIQTAITKLEEHYSKAPEGKRAKNAAAKLVAVVDAARELRRCSECHGAGVLIRSV